MPFYGRSRQESCPELYNTLKTKFGPGRRENNSYPEVAFANAFIGNYLRLEMLSENNEREQVLRELEGYFWAWRRERALFGSTTVRRRAAITALPHMCFTGCLNSAEGV